MPRLVRLMPASDSIELDDPNGEWAFRFNPEDHDYDAKVLFEGTDWEIQIPEGREGSEGLRDALDVIDNHAHELYDGHSYSGTSSVLLDSMPLVYAPLPSSVLNFAHSS